MDRPRARADTTSPFRPFRPEPNFDWYRPNAAQRLVLVNFLIATTWRYKGYSWFDTSTVRARGARNVRRCEYVDFNVHAEDPQALGHPGADGLRINLLHFSGGCKIDSKTKIDPIERSLWYTAVGPLKSLRDQNTGNGKSMESCPY